MHTKSSSPISIGKWTATYCLANTVGMFLILAIMNIGFTAGEIFIYLTIEDKLSSPIILYYPAVVFGLAFIALTTLTFWLPLDLFREKVDVNRVCLTIIPLQSLVGFFS